MKIYRYDNDGVFFIEDEAYIDPAETKKQGKNVYMLPANATFEEPPTCRKNEIQVFKNGAWTIVKDYTGSYTCDKDLNITIVDYLGEIKDGYILITEEQAKKIYEDKLFYVVSNGQLIPNPTYAEDKAKEREKTFKQQFFQTSLGWIRRKVNMKDGATKDFLADLLLPIKAGLELGQKVVIITYKTPDFTIDYSEEYIISLQEKKEATVEFIQECLMQTVADFGGV